MGSISGSVLTPVTGDIYVIRLNGTIISQGTITNNNGALTFTPSADSPGPQTSFTGTLSGGTLAIQSIPHGGGTLVGFSAKRVIRIGFSQSKIDESDWRKAQTKSIEDAFPKPGFELILRDANNNTSLQRTHVQNFINDRVDYIIITAVDSGGWNDVLTNARNAGIPIILADRSINANNSLWTSHISSNFYEEGLSAAKWIETRFTGNQVNIVHIQGGIGALAQVGRTKGFDEVLNRNPSTWNRLERASGEWSFDKAKELMAEWIVKHNNINAVFAENDNMAAGAIAALLEANIPIAGISTPGVVIATVDAMRTSLQMMFTYKRPHINVECSPFYGPAIRKIIGELEEGKTPERYAYADFTAFTYNTITQTMVNNRPY
jgi:simple sugar transport system substrate-binding protein